MSAISVVLLLIRGSLRAAKELKRVLILHITLLKTQDVFYEPLPHAEVRSPKLKPRF